jgi:hypothetical protein
MAIEIGTPTQAPLRRRFAAGLIDTCVMGAVPLAACVPLAALSAPFPELLPLSVFASSALTGVWVAWYLRYRSPGSRRASAGLTLLRLARVRAEHGARTIALGPDPHSTATRGSLALAWVIAVPSVIVAALCVTLAGGTVGALAYGAMFGASERAAGTRDGEVAYRMSRALLAEIRKDPAHGGEALVAGHASAALPAYRERVVGRRIGGFQTTMSGNSGAGPWGFQYDEVRDDTTIPMGSSVSIVVEKRTPWWDSCGSFRDFRIVTLEFADAITQ